MSTFSTILIANRGEIACRIIRSAHALGYRTVAVYSQADADAPHVGLADRAVLIGPPPVRESYLNVERLLAAAADAGADAVHPGYGFLSENAEFAQACADAGLVFIGPSPAAIHAMGNKAAAKRSMIAAGVPCIPGFQDSSDDGQSDDRLYLEALKIGLPVLIKAAAGGGGRGMRKVKAESELAAAIRSARSEASSAFASGELIVERAIVDGRHVEIQIIADRWGHACHLGERDCTVQRNHQKLIEESPSPVLDELVRSATLAAAVEAARSIGYVGAGTMEFLLDRDPTTGVGVLRFMEMNCRLQVEHCVSEQRAGVDLVHEQIRVAAGHRLSFRQEQIDLCGHAIECRINAEDPSAGFRPAPGLITAWQVPSGPGIRVDTHVQPGYVVPPHYDSLLCKVIATAESRDAAADRMIAALGELRCEGVPTTAAMHRQILASPAFRSHQYDTRTIPGWP